MEVQRTVSSGIFLSQSSAVYAVCFSKDCSSIYVGEVNAQVTHWQMPRTKIGLPKKKKVLVIAEPKALVLSLNLSSDESQIICGLFSGHVKVYDTRSWALLRSFSSHSPHRTATASLLQSQSLAISGSLDCTARLWNTETMEEVRRWTFLEEVTSVKITESQHVFMSTAARVIRDSVSGRQSEITLDCGGTVLCLSASSCGNLVLAGCEDCRIYMFKIDNGVLQDSCSFAAHHHAVTAIVLSKSKTRAVSGSYSDISLWSFVDPSSPVAILKFEGSDNWIYSLSWSTRGTMLLSGGNDKVLLFTFFEYSESHY